MRILALFIIIIILKKSFTGDSDEYFCSSALLFGKSGSVSSELMLFDLFVLFIYIFWLYHAACRISVP